MSRFQETFTRSETEKILTYDDSAAVYFLGCIFCCIVVVWSGFFLYDLFFSNSSKHLAELHPKDKVKRCCCTLCVSKDKQLGTPSTLFSCKLCRKKYVVQMILLILCWFFVFRIARSLAQSGEMQTFNPFEILEIPSSATTMDARKAYLRLSRLHHPDRNPNDPAASARFILITKAYTALTDEVARANYAKYGNPDGPGAMKIGIGLPTFLTSAHYELLVLFFFFSTLLLVVPAIFITYFQRQKNYLPTGLRLDTAQLCAYSIKEGTRVKALVEILAASGESRELTHIRESDNKDMKAICNEVTIPTKKTLCTTPLVLRNYILLLAHLQNQRHLLSESLIKDLNILLTHSDLITQCMAEIAFHQRWFLTLQSVIELRRRLVQGVDLSGLSAPFLQVPHFHEGIVRKCIRWRKLLKDLAPLVTEQLENPSNQIFPLSKEELEDVSCFLKCLPILRLSAVAFVADEDEIVEGDIITLQLTLVRENLKEGMFCGVVHAPLFPQLRHESWWLLICEKSSNRLINFIRTKNLAKSWTESIQFEAPTCGKWTFQCLAMSDDYVGVDAVTEVSVNVVSAASAQRSTYVDDDDDELADTAPSIFQQFMGQVVNAKETSAPVSCSSDDSSSSSFSS